MAEKTKQRFNNNRKEVAEMQNKEQTGKMAHTINRFKWIYSLQFTLTNSLIKATIELHCLRDAFSNSPPLNYN